MTAVLLLLVFISITTILLLRIQRVMGKQTSKCPPYWYQREPNASLWLVNSRQCEPLIGRLWWHPQFLEKCLILLWVPIFWSAGFITNNYSLWYGAISRHENPAFVIMPHHYHIFLSWVLQFHSSSLKDIDLIIIFGWFLQQPTLNLFIFFSCKKAWCCKCWYWGVFF